VVVYLFSTFFTGEFSYKVIIKTMFSDPEKIISQFSVGKGTTVADFGTGSGNYAFAAAEAWVNREKFTL
jgi:tRNA A58 N-methylase Trm61